VFFVQLRIASIGMSPLGAIRINAQTKSFI